MKVLTLTTKEQVDEYSSSLLIQVREGHYDKIVIKSITGLSGSSLGSKVDRFLWWVENIEIQNCTITGYFSIHWATMSKITIKDSTIQEFYYHSCGSLIMDNVTTDGIYISNTSDAISLTFKNSKLNIRNVDVDPNTTTIELFNNHDSVIFGLPVKCIPNNAAKQSAFLSQIKILMTTVAVSEIDEFNYQFEQSDWDKLILLLDKYPNLFKNIRFDNNFRSKLYTKNYIYIHIPSTTFPLNWIGNLDYEYNHVWSIKPISKDHTWFYINKNNGYNFTITHIDMLDINDWSNGIMSKGFLIADNYEDIIAAQPSKSKSMSGSVLFQFSMPSADFPNILSGKMVTSEITLLPNTYFLIRTIGSDMKIKRIKEVTRFHGKTIKVTGMEPFIVLSIAGTVYRVIDGDVKVEINQPSPETVISGSITVKPLSMADIDGNTIIQQETHTDIIGNVGINQIESFIYGNASVEAVQETNMNGAISITVPNQEVDIDLDGAFQLVQAVSTDIIGDIEVRICRIEILGYFEIPMEEVQG